MGLRIRNHIYKQTAINGTATTFCCFVIFILFIDKTELGLESAAVDLPVTIIINAVIASSLQMILNKRAVKNGDVPYMGEIDKQGIYIYLPQNLGAYFIGSICFSTYAFLCAPVGFWYIATRQMVLPSFPYMLIKSLLCGGVALYCTLYGNVFVCALYQRKYVTRKEGRQEL